MTNKDYARIGKAFELLTEIARRVDEISPFRLQVRDELRKLGMSEEFVNGTIRQLMNAYMPTLTEGRVYLDVINAVKEANA